jgi:hypothetical protein
MPWVGMAAETLSGFLDFAPVSNEERGIVQALRSK